MIPILALLAFTAGLLTPWAWPVAIAGLAILALGWLWEATQRERDAIRWAAKVHRARRELALQRQAPGGLQVHADVLDCGCVHVPDQWVTCPADAALAEVEGKAAGHG